ncbi:MAG: hypothetical protein R8J41_00345 [Alphaproteobacteria bacterium]|nr:hypothetical protein [Alphaproteobacteria bacterium]
MAWVFGIVALIIAIIFWRVSLVLGGVAIVVIAIWVLNNQQEQRERQQAALDRAELRILKIQKGKSSAYPREWVAHPRNDPASGLGIVRGVSITSDDGLCTLTVEKRLSGQELTGVHCPGFPFPGFSDLEAKFDGDSNSMRLELENYSGSYGASDNVYIPSKTSPYSGYTTYEEFTNGMVRNSYVAIRLPQGSHWPRFKLQGSSNALSMLGERVVAFEDRYYQVPMDATKPEIRELLERDVAASNNPRIRINPN